MKNSKTGIISNKANSSRLSFFCTLLWIIYLGIVLTTFISHSSFATTYYLSNSGDDSFSGTRQDSAWRTINKLNTVTLQQGDSVLFRTGDIFRGQVDLSASGTSSQKIYFGYYGSGNHPVISGAEPVSGWTKFSGNIYSANFPQLISGFFVNGKMMISARYPDSGFLTIDSSGVSTGLYDAALNQPDNYWKGAVLKVRSADNKYEQTEIQSFSGGWLEFTIPLKNNLDAGYGYYLDHTFAALDTVNEWYYDPLQKKIYFYSVTDPNALITEGSVYNYGVNASDNSSFLKFEGIDFEKQVKDGARFNGTSSNILFDDCGFKYCYSKGIDFNVTANDTINRCLFHSICGQGVKADIFNQSVIRNCILKNTGIIPGYGLEEINEWDAILLPNANESVISANTIDSVGFIGIVISGKNNRVEKNLIENCVLSLNSGAAIFIFNSDSSNTMLEDNFIFNTWGNNDATPGNKISADGITVNGQCSFVSFLHNTIANIQTYGINLNSGNQNNVLSGNVIYNSGQAQVCFTEIDTIRRTVENSISNNIFYCLNDVQRPLLLDGRKSSFNAGLFNSNYYCNPYDYYPVYRFDLDSVTDFAPVSFSDWKTASGDLNAKKSLVQWQTRSVTDTIGTDIVSNGDFTNNFDGWETSDYSNCEILLDNNAGLDGGCVKLIMTEDTPVVWGQIHSSVAFSFPENEWYQFSFSTRSAYKLNMKTFIQSRSAPYPSLTRYKFFPVDTVRTSYNYVFLPINGSQKAGIFFEIDYSDSMVWLDNIRLYKVNTTRHDTSRLSRLITNYSSVPVNFSLGDSSYHDLDGNLVKGSYPLQAYSSYILTLDSPLFVSANVFQSVQKDIKIFPNPLNPEIQLLNYSFKTSDQNEKYHLQIFDILGRRIINEELINNSGTIRIPSATAAGLYLIKLFNSQNSFERKLAVTH